MSEEAFQRAFRQVTVFGIPEEAARIMFEAGRATFKDVGQAYVSKTSKNLFLASREHRGLKHVFPIYKERE